MGLQEEFRRAMASVAGEDTPAVFEPLENDPVFQVINAHTESLREHNETLENIRRIEEDLAASGGVNRSLATECFKVLEGFGAGRIKLEHYTTSISRTNFKLTMEEIDHKKAGLIAAAVAAVIALIATIGRWIYKKLSGDDSSDSGGSGGGGGGGSSDADFTGASKTAEAAVETVQTEFTDMSEDVEKYVGNLKKYGDMLQKNVNLFQSEGFKRLLDAENKLNDADTKIANASPEDVEDAKKEKEALKKEKEELKAELRRKVAQMLTSSEGILKAAKGANDFWTFNQILPDHLKNKSLNQLLSANDHDYNTFVAKPEYTGAMNAACSTFPSLLQMTDHVLNIAEEGVEAFSKLKDAEITDDSMYGIPAHVKDFIDNKDKPTGPCSIAFMGKQTLITEVIEKIKEMQNKPPSVTGEVTVSRVMDSIKVNYINGDIKAYMMGSAELMKRIDVLRDRLLALQNLTDQQVDTAGSADGTNKIKLEQKKATVEMVRVCTTYVRDALHLATLILNYSMQYTSFVERFTTIVRNEMIRPDILKHIEDMRKKTRHMLLDFQKKFGMSDNDFEDYFVDFEEIMREDIDEERLKMIRELDKAQIGFSGWRFDPKRIQGGQHLVSRAGTTFGRLWQYIGHGSK